MFFPAQNHRTQTEEQDGCPQSGDLSLSDCHATGLHGRSHDIAEHEHGAFHTDVYRTVREAIRFRGGK